MSPVAQMSIQETLRDNFHELPHYHPEDMTKEVRFTFKICKFLLIIIRLTDHNL